MPVCQSVQFKLKIQGTVSNVFIYDRTAYTMVQRHKNWQYAYIETDELYNQDLTKPYLYFFDSECTNYQ